MPNYEEQIENSNINYLNKDFNQYRNTLIKYAKTYFPNTYKDFNETSPGMMLIEMASYVGDVLSFYIDQQYQEMLLPLAQERKNVISIAKMLGYKVKPIVPAYVNLTVKQTIPSTATLDPIPNLDNIQPIYDQKSLVIDKGMRVQSSIDSTVRFETLDIVDFSVSSSVDLPPEPTTFDPDSGLVTEYTLTRKVRAVSGESKTSQFDIGAPAQFRKITLDEKNVIDIISVIDSNGNTWYEVDYLAQDKIPIDVHYLQDDLRGTAYTDIGGREGESEVIPVSNIMEYIKTSKRFIKETNVDNSTSLVFGNGILRNGQSNLETGYLQSLNAGITYAGQVEDLSSFISPLLGDSTATLGEVPAHTSLTVTYRVGGGTKSNVPTSDLVTISNYDLIGNALSIPSDVTLSVTNDEPAVGGTNQENIDEIRENAKAFFTTQNRCVTKEDYEARIKNMSSKFGSVAKSYVERIDVGGENGMLATETVDYVNRVLGTFDNFLNWSFDNPELPEGATIPSLLQNANDAFGWGQGSLNTFDFNADGSLDTLDVTQITEGIQSSLGTVKVYIMGYDNNKNLIGDPWKGTEVCSGCTGIKTPDLIRQNIKTYLEQFRIITDEVSITDGYVINFGVVFDVVADKTAVKQQVKLACIEKIKNYFRIEKMQFRQPIYTSDLSYQLMNVNGVRAVNYVILTQDNNWITDPLGNTPVFSPALYDSVFDSEGLVKPATDTNNGYGYQYSFGDFYTYDLADGTTHTSVTNGVDGVILPSKSPAVFELKNPNQNIRGVVR